jgi:hypothetical protein
MPEHIHLLISEPDRGSVSTVMQVLKQRFARKLLRELRTRSPLQQPSLWEAMEDAHIWQKRFYDFVVLSEKKVGEVALHSSQSGEGNRRGGYGFSRDAWRYGNTRSWYPPFENREGWGSRQRTPFHAFAECERARSPSTSLRMTE